MTNLNFFLADDDLVIRSMISEIIEDSDLGVVIGEASDGSQIDVHELNARHVDILIIDQLMPIMDGLETLSKFDHQFNGKTIMISQVSDKDIIGEAYSQGIAYYITKPINRLELLGVLERVIKQIQLERSISAIHHTLSGLQIEKPQVTHKISLVSAGKHLLTELGIIGAAGSKDLLDQLSYLEERRLNEHADADFPALKELFTAVASKKLGLTAEEHEIKKEIKAAEQRVRRAIYQALNHLASIGLVDFNHPKFEEYASAFFNFSEVRQRMLELKQNGKDTPFESTINTKRFVKVLYYESLNRTQ